MSQDDEHVGSVLECLPDRRYEPQARRLLQDFPDIVRQVGPSVVATLAALMGAGSPLIAMGVTAVGFCLASVSRGNKKTIEAVFDALMELEARIEGVGDEFLKSPGFRRELYKAVEEVTSRQNTERLEHLFSPTKDPMCWGALALDIDELVLDFLCERAESRGRERIHLNHDDFVELVAMTSTLDEAAESIDMLKHDGKLKVERYQGMFVCGPLPGGRPGGVIATCVELRNRTLRDHYAKQGTNIRDAELTLARLVCEENFETMEAVSERTGWSWLFVRTLVKHLERREFLSVSWMITKPEARFRSTSALRRYHRKNG